MNAFQQCAQTWWAWTSAASWQLAVFVAVLAVLALAGRSLPARLRYVLWSLVLVKALIPPSASTPLSVGTWGIAPVAEWVAARVAPPQPPQPPSATRLPPPQAAAAQPAVAAALPFKPAGAADSSRPFPEMPDPAPARAGGIPPAWTQMLLLAWLAGSTLFAGVVGVRYMRLLRAVRRAHEVDEGPLRVRLESLAMQLGRNSAPDLLLSGEVTSPFLVGVLHPRIILPAGLPQALSGQETDSVLLHELVHWQRRDLLVGWLQVLVQALFWFHPFVWYANARLHHERESACDAAVLAAGEISPKGYGESLLKVLLEARGRSSASLGFLGIFERNTRLQNRLEEIMNYESRSRNLGMTGWLLVAAFAVVFLPMARADENNRQEDQAPPDDSIRIVRKTVKTETPRTVTRVVRHGAAGSTTETAIVRELAPMIPPLRDRFVEIHRLAVNDGKLSDALALLRKARPGFDAFMNHAREIAPEPQMAEAMATLDKLDMALQQGNVDESRRILKQLGHMGEAIEEQLKQGQETDSSKTEREVPPIPQEPLPPGTTMIGYVGDKEQGKRSIATSGHGVKFSSTAKARWIEAVQIFASRYGTQQPPEEDFHLYVLNSDMQILADVKYPYATIGRGGMKWYTLRTPSIEVPEEFVVALSFDPHETKGIYLGYDKPQGESRSLMGLPDDGFVPDKRGREWMVRTHLCEQPTGQKGTMRLADWKPPVKETLFKNCIEAKFDNGNPDGMQSYGSRGPAIRIRPSDFLTTASAGEWELAGLTLYASRYGAGYDPAKTMVQVTVLGPDNQVLEQTEVSYDTFGYKPRWVEVPLSTALKIAKPGDMLTIAFDPKAQQTKGIYFHYNKNPQTSHSLAGTMEKGFEPTPDREWMIRCHFAPAGGQKTK